jgi:predicted RNase H-like nuclease (RuvC/YqgF family)
MSPLRAFQFPKMKKVFASPFLLTVAIISGIRILRERVNHLTSHNNDQKARIRELENELNYQKAIYNVEVAKIKEMESRGFRQSYQDSGFGSADDSEALEKLKESHAKDRMSRFPRAPH